MTNDQFNLSISSPMKFSSNFSDRSSVPFGLPDNSFILLRDLIHERTGIIYSDASRDLLAQKLVPRVIACGFDSFLDYYYLLKYDDTAEVEWQKIIDAISVPETFFLREMDQVEALVNVLVPEHFAKYPHQPLRIWSAACATGEEPLSIAMALNEAGWLNTAPITIDASDGSPAAIAKAKAGLYRERSFRNFPANLRDLYFRESGKDQWQIIPVIHQRIHWSIANLMSESDIKYLAAANIIFCRNVFIYFSEKTIRKTIHLFAQAMPKPGYLCIAAAESLLKLTHAFELEEIGGAFIYVKH